MKYCDFSDFRLFCILVCKIHQSPEKKLEPIKFWLLFSYVAQKCITTALTKKIERIYKLVHTKMPISERLLIVNSSHLKNFLKHILETGVNRKSEFRWVWKFCWDLSNVLQGGKWLFRWDCIFFRWDFVPLCELRPSHYLTICHMAMISFVINWKGKSCITSHLYEPMRNLQLNTTLKNCGNLTKLKRNGIYILIDAKLHMFKYNTLNSCFSESTTFPS